MMIDDVMYGMIPSAKMANWVSAPPENSCRKPSTPRPARPGAASSLDRVEVDARRRDVRPEPVQGDDQQREQDLAPQVGDPEHVLQAGQHGWLLVSGAAGQRSLGQRLANWLPLTGGRRSPHGRGRTSTLPPAAVMAASADLEKRVGLHRDGSGRARPGRAPSPGRPCGRGRARAASSGLTSVERRSPRCTSRLMPWYSTRNGLLKPFSFGMRMCSGIWPPSKPTGDLAAGLLALGAAAGGLAALAADAPADALLAPVRARRRASDRGS